MRITELFTAQSIALDEALENREQILSRLVELQATHGNITDKAAYKKALYAREAEGSTYVDNGITVPHAKTDVVTRPSLAALRHLRVPGGGPRRAVLRGAGRGQRAGRGDPEPAQKEPHRRRVKNAISSHLEIP